MAGYEGLVARLARNAARTPAKPAVVFCRGNGDTYTEESLSYGELDRAVRATAAWLRTRCQAGDRALLLYPQGLEFVTGFLGCMFAGMTPVAAPLPTAYKSHSDRAAAIGRDAQASIVLTDVASLPDISGWLGDSGLAEVMSAGAGAPGIGGAADAAAQPAAPGWAPPAIDPQSLAFLQYTSGSTSTPRGVMVSHRNLEHNLRSMQTTLGWHDEWRFCSWLPMYHDMGLIAMLFGPLYLGTTVILLTPTDFLKRPQLWLQLIDAHDAAISSAPNFAYDLCARRLTDTQIDELDLSRWRCAANGSEPIDAATLTRFTDRFGRAGFRPEALAPGYGLAEATLCVSGTRQDRVPVVCQVDAEALEQHKIRPVRAGKSRRAMVSSGQIACHDVRIVDPYTRQVQPAGQIAEIWVRSESVAQGYWRRPQETERTFDAVTADGEGPFLRTGDLGMAEDGELFITGRIKEMLIIHGRNLYPHDIEREARAANQAFADRICCVFSVPTPEEEIVVVQELRVARLDEAALAELAAQLRRSVWAALDVRAANVVFVKVGRVVKTTSGKIRRTLMSELFRTGELDSIYEDLDAATRARYRAGAKGPAGARPAAALTGSGLGVSVRQRA